MKKFYLFGLVILSVLFTVTLSSCSKDDDEEETASIIGTWVSTRLEGSFDGTAYDVTFDPSNPADVWYNDGLCFSCVKFQIYQTTSGKFALLNYYYDSTNKEWVESELTGYTIDDTSKTFYFSTNYIDAEVTIESVTSTQLVATQIVTYDTGISEKSKITMKRME